MMFMIGMPTIAAITQQTNDKYGGMYCQVWLFDSIHSKRVFWIADLTINSVNGAILDGGYNWWLFYDLINNQHTTSILKFQNNNQNMCCISPQNTKISGKAETVTFTTGGRSDVAWAVNYPEFTQYLTDCTNSFAVWNFKAHRAINGGYIY